MDSNDVNNYVRYGRAFTSPRCFYVLLDEFDIVRVAALNLVLKPMDCLCVSQSLAGPLKIYPAKPDPPAGVPKPPLRISLKASKLRPHLGTSLEWGDFANAKYFHNDSVCAKIFISLVEHEITTLHRNQ